MIPATEYAHSSGAEIAYRVVGEGPRDILFTLAFASNLDLLWEVPERSNAIAVMGSVVLDMREARFAGQESVVDAVAIMGSVEVVVNAGTRVVVDGIGIMGDFTEGRSKVAAELGPQAPVVRVRGLALMGSVVVRRKELPGESRRRLGRG